MNEAAEFTPTSPELLDMLVCPVTRWPLRVDGDRLIATAPDGAEALSYPIRGIPLMLVDHASAPGGEEVSSWIERWTQSQAGGGHEA